MKYIFLLFTYCIVLSTTLLSNFPQEDKFHYYNQLQDDSLELSELSDDNDQIDCLVSGSFQGFVSLSSSIGIVLLLKKLNQEPHKLSMNFLLYSGFAGVICSGLGYSVIKLGKKCYKNFNRLISKDEIAN